MTCGASRFRLQVPQPGWCTLQAYKLRSQRSTGTRGMSCATVLEATGSIPTNPYKLLRKEVYKINHQNEPSVASNPFHCPLTSLKVFRLQFQSAILRTVAPGMSRLLSECGLQITYINLKCTHLPRTSGATNICNARTVLAYKLNLNTRALHRNNIKSKAVDPALRAK